MCNNTHKKKAAGAGKDFTLFFGVMLHFNFKCVGGVGLNGAGVDFSLEVTLNNKKEAWEIEGGKPITNEPITWLRRTTQAEGQTLFFRWVFLFYLL